MASENLAPQVISRLMGEVRELVRKPAEGIEYVESEENSISEIHAIITGPEETPFYGGKFRMKLVISDEYPNVPPKGYFMTRIFHPNVALNGDICVNTLKRDWNCDVTIKHVLQVIRCLLIIPFPESSLNDEAGKMFMESYEEYASRARIMTQVHAMTSESKGKFLSTHTDDFVTTNGGLAGEEEIASVVQQKKKEKDIKKKNLKRL